MRKFYSLAFVFIIGCASPAQYKCGPTDHCSGNPTEFVQSAIDVIVIHNFPEEKGQYKAVMWMDGDIMNAWVTNDKNVNISTSLYKNLKDKQILAVIAHELAHLKLGHYYQKMGVSILATAGQVALSALNPLAGYIPVDQVATAAFSRSKETEADIEAVKYLIKSGYSKQDFLSLLHWMRYNSSGRRDPFFASHPHIEDRIESVIHSPELAAFKF